MLFNKVISKNMSSQIVHRNARRRNCTLVVTHRCNLQCRYCYEEYKDSGRMSFMVAREIIQHEFANALTSGTVDEILFDFLGGEPMLEFDLIRRVAEWAWSETRQVPYLFSLTTNGTILDEEIKCWLRANASRFKVVLSLDGGRLSHDINRSGSHINIDRSFFRDVFPDQPVKMTVTPETVSNFFNDVAELTEEGFLVAPSFAYGVNWTDCSIQEYGRQLLLLSDWFLSHQEKETIPQLQRELSPILEDGKIRRTCGAGVMMCCYDIDGKSYPCHLFLPWISHRDGLLDVLCSDDELCDERCIDCSYVRICKHCYGMNYKLRGNPSIRSSEQCQLLQAEINACISYKGNRLGGFLRHGKHLNSDDLQEARAIIRLAGLIPETIPKVERSAKS